MASGWGANPNPGEVGEGQHLRYKRRRPPAATADAVHAQTPEAFGMQMSTATAGSDGQVQPQGQVSGQVSGQVQPQLQLQYGQQQLQHLQQEQLPPTLTLTLTLTLNLTLTLTLTLTLSPNPNPNPNLPGRPRRWA